MVIYTARSHSSRTAHDAYKYTIENERERERESRGMSHFTLGTASGALVSFTMFAYSSVTLYNSSERQD